jgi:hypothetical protein
VATPTAGELWTQMQNLVAKYEALRSTVQTATTGLVARADAEIEALEGDHAPDRAAAVGAFRGGLAGAMRAGFDPGLRSLLMDYGRLYGFPQTGNIRGMLADLYKVWAEISPTPETLKTRAITFGTPTFTTPTGTGALRRLTKDAYNYDIEGIASLGSGEAFTFEVLSDQSTSGAARNREILRVRGKPARPLERVGSGVDTTIQAVSGSDSARIVTNPTFTLGTSASSITGWTVASGNVNTTAQDTTNYYVADEGETGTSLSSTASITLYQQLNTYGRKLDPSVPYYVEVAYNAQVGTAVGDLRLDFGSDYDTVAVGGKTGWQVLYLPLDDDRWLRNFAEDNLDLRITWTRTSGTIRIARVMVVPMEQIAGTWFTLLGGATPFVIGDAGSWTDTETGAVVQNFLADYTAGGYLPHAVSPTRADPT